MGCVVQDCLTDGDIAVFAESCTSSSSSSRRIGSSFATFLPFEELFSATAASRAASRSEFGVLPLDLVPIVLRRCACTSTCRSLGRNFETRFRYLGGSSTNLLVLSVLGAGAKEAKDAIVARKSWVPRLLVSRDTGSTLLLWDWCSSSFAISSWKSEILSVIACRTCRAATSSSSSSSVLTDCGTAPDARFGGAAASS